MSKKHIKRLLNEDEYDIENDQGQGLCYQRGRRQRWITQPEALIILDVIRKPNSIIVLLYIQKLERKQSHFVYAFKHMEFSRAF